MKWMLVVMIFGSHAVKTDVIFDTLDKCLAAEEAVRAEQASCQSEAARWRAQRVGRIASPHAIAHALGETGSSGETARGPHAIFHLSGQEVGRDEI